MTPITVTNWGTSQYLIKSEPGDGTPPTCRYTAKSDPSHAAAEALSLARQHEQYVIIAPHDVLSFIPEQLQKRP